LKGEEKRNRRKVKRSCKRGEEKSKKGREDTV
jgi:hypothetical protein